ncbi:MAG: ATP-binding protein [Acidobacteria bacterium]|nr:ATP-binding protein [Acidobacteriota bacterium]
MATTPGSRSLITWVAAARTYGGHFAHWLEGRIGTLLGVAGVALLLLEFAHLEAIRACEAIEQQLGSRHRLVSALGGAQVSVLHRAALTQAAVSSGMVASAELRAAHQNSRDAWERLRLASLPEFSGELAELESLFSEQTLQLKRSAAQASARPPIPADPADTQLTVQLSRRLQAAAHAERQLLAQARQHLDAYRARHSGIEWWKAVDVSLLLILGAFALATGWRRARSAKDQLQLKTAELLDAQRLARVGSWHWQIGPDHVDWSPELYSIAQWDPRLAPPNYAQHPQLYTPESWARLSSAVQGALEQGIAYELDLEMVRQTGEHLRVVARGEAQRDAHGRIARLRGTLQDVTARWEVEEALRRARDTAETAVKSKSEFLATMSHEIRTPMNGVIGMTSLLMETPLTVEQREYLEIVRSSGESLLAIINDILDFSKIEAGMLVLEKVPFDPRQIVEEAIGVVADLASVKGLKLSYWVSSDVALSCLGDPVRLRQVVLNLLSNAIKFTPQGTVSLMVDLPEMTGQLPPPVRFSVVDTGIGLSDQQQARLFQSFSQADGSTTRKYGGTGLGLSISRRMVELMGGEIGVISQLGEGSTFWFTADLPAVNQAAPIAPTEQALRGEVVLLVTADPVFSLMARELMESVGLQVVVAGLDDAVAAKPPAGRHWAVAALDLGSLGPDLEGLARQLRARAASLPLLLIGGPGSHPHDVGRLGLDHAALLALPLRKGSLVRVLGRLLELADPAPAGPAPELIGTTVLLAEDNVTNQILATAMLERLGCVVELAVNGREAVRAATEHPFGLIFMDCQMPEMDGWEAARLIRQNLPHHIPIIALTANALTGDRERCLEAGMDDYLTKPISLDALRTQLNKWARGRQPDELAPGEPVTVAQPPSAPSLS